MSAAPRVLVAVATYNELENLPSLIDAIWSALPAADIVVVDDDSPDGTGAWCQTRAATSSQLTCICRHNERGLGSATICALRRAIDQQYDLIVTMDADFSHPPERLPAIIDQAQHADVVIGSRYVDGGAIEGWPWSRRVVSRAMNTASRWFAGMAARDSSGAYRCYHVAALERIRLEDVKSGGFAYLEEILFLLQRSGATIREVPITFRDREKGHSKVALGEVFGKISTLGRLALMRVTSRSYPSNNPASDKG